MKTPRKGNTPHGGETPRENRGMLSRLPDDGEYWDNFTSRIVDDASPHLAARRDDRGEWWSAMASFSTVLATGAVAATLALISLLPAQQVGAGPAVPEARAADLFGIAPDDPLAAPLLVADSPPTMDALIWSTPGSQP